MVLPLKLHRAGQTKANLDASNLALFDAADQFQQFDDSVLQTEIAVTELSARTVFAAAEFQLLNDSGRRIEGRLSLGYLQGFHAPEIHGLQQLY